MGAMKEAAAASLYEADYHAWTLDQAAKLRRGDFGHLDIANLVEEVESLGRSEERELESRLSQLLMHLLKWQHQGALRSKSGTATIDEQRRRVHRLLQKMPSLRGRVDDVIDDAYGDARLLAERETGLPITTFAERCPCSAAQVLAADWLPLT